MIVIGEGSHDAAAGLAGLVETASAVPATGFSPGRWADALAGHLGEAAFVVVPRSPDGRDLAPRLAAALEWDLHAGCTDVTAELVVVVRQGGRVQHEIVPEGRFVATLEPGVVGVVAPDVAAPIDVAVLRLDFDDATADPVTVELQPPDPATVDLAEAGRIVGAGAGLVAGADRATADARIESLRRVGLALGASLGATRVVTDAGHLGHERQIGTTGAVVRPELYLAFGVSGAVQHTAGLGRPEHIVSVNTDPHCPMMAMADLAIVADAPAVVAELEARLAADQGLVAQGARR